MGFAVSCAVFSNDNVVPVFPVFFEQYTAGKTDTVLIRGHRRKGAVQHDADDDDDDWRRRRAVVTEEYPVPAAAAAVGGIHGPGVPASCAPHRTERAPTPFGHGFARRCHVPSAVTVAPRTSVLATAV